VKIFHTRTDDRHTISFKSTRKMLFGAERFWVGHRCWAGDLREIGEKASREDAPKPPFSHVCETPETLAKLLSC